MKQKCSNSFVVRSVCTQLYFTFFVDNFDAIFWFKMYELTVKNYVFKSHFVFFFEQFGLKFYKDLGNQISIKLPRPLKTAFLKIDDQSANARFEKWQIRAFYLIYTSCVSYFCVPLNYSCRAQSASCNKTKSSEYLINFREIFEKSKSIIIVRDVLKFRAANNVSVLRVQLALRVIIISLIRFRPFSNIQYSYLLYTLTELYTEVELLVILCTYISPEADLWTRPSMYTHIIET